MVTRLNVYPAHEEVLPIELSIPTGLVAVEETYNPYNRFDGPGILAVIGTSNAADVKLTAGFDGIVVSER